MNQLKGTGIVQIGYRNGNAQRYVESVLRELGWASKREMLQPVYKGAKPEVEAILRKMLSEGEAVQTGRGKGTKYGLRGQIELASGDESGG
jgi:hypothetical protein